jgi:hypothetical protein
MRPICRFLASSSQFLASAIWSCVLSGAAFLAMPADAADMGVPARSYYPPLPPAIYDWTGIYLGGHVGGGMLNDYAGQNPGTTAPINLLTFGSLRPTGVIGGSRVAPIMNLRLGSSVSKAAGAIRQLAEIL